MFSDRPSAAVVHRDRNEHPRHFAPNVAAPVAVMVTVMPLGHVASRAMWSMMKSSRLNWSAPSLGFRPSGIALIAACGAPRRARPGRRRTRTRNRRELADPAPHPRAADAGRAVAGVGRGERGRGDQPGLGFDRDVGFEPVAVVTDALVHVPRLRVDRRDDPVGRDSLRDPPRALAVAGFDVLAGDQRQQPDRVGLGIVKTHTVERVDDRECVVHQR